MERESRNFVIQSDEATKICLSNFFSVRSFLFDKRTLIVLTCLSVLCLSSFAIAEQPLSPAASAVKSTIEEIRKVVRQDQGKIPEVELNKKLEKVIFPVFDFTEMSRRCIGKNWEEGSPAEQQEFIDLFTSMLSRTYIEKIKKVESRTVNYVGDIVKGNKAVVRTVTVHEDGEEVKLDYRLRDNNGNWQIYDVIIENVGLVTNYRSEFAGIVRKKKFSGLLVDLRQKVKDRAAGDTIALSPLEKKIEEIEK